VLNAIIIQIGFARPVQLIVQGLIIAGAVVLQGGGES
jgi:ribose/xylose/arabinose/galactoside ABC-type transport system permease subunit